MGASPRAQLQACRLPGLSQDAWCGSVLRPLDPVNPQGVKIEIRYAVLPALARNKKPDPIFFFAGGPGQSAKALAGPLSRQFSRALNRRDLVLVDQRGTGGSAPLKCEGGGPGQPLREASFAAQAKLLESCRQALQQLPHGDLRFYSTALAMADVDAVREALGAEAINLVGGSYGTRAALEYQRQFPQRVRRTVIDGVAPPDMALPQSFAGDSQVSLDALIRACDEDAACRAAHGPLRDKWRALMAGLPREVSVAHPMSGASESLTLTRELLLAWVRLPLYVPALAAGLPHAISEAAAGRFGPMVGLVSSLGGGRQAATRMAEGMHFSVVCAEDLPVMGATAARAEPPAPDYGDIFAGFYRQVCANWPKAAVPAEFYRVPPARTPVLVLSGGADPATPPRHGERVVQALGVQARHVVVPQAGHGVMSLPCLRDVLFRFFDAPLDTDALKVDVECAIGVPRATAFRPLAPAAAQNQHAGKERP